MTNESARQQRIARPRGWIWGICTLLAAACPVGAENMVGLVPDVKTAVRLSNTDNNRVICPQRVVDVVFSEEKPVVVKVKGKDAYIKFKIKVMPDGTELLANARIEFFVVCRDATYTLIGLPERIEAQTVRLAPGKGDVIAANRRAMAGKDHEQRVVFFIESAYRDELPESFEKSKVHRIIRFCEGPPQGGPASPSPSARARRCKKVTATQYRDVRAEGEGLRLGEYWVETEQTVELREADFLSDALGQQIVGVSLEPPHRIEPGQKRRLFVVQKSL